VSILGALLLMVSAIASATVLLTRAWISRRAKIAVIVTGFVLGLASILVWRPISNTEWGLGAPLTIATAEFHGSALVGLPRAAEDVLPHVFGDFALAFSIACAASLLFLRIHPRTARP
jgi:hypothetical protein